MAVLPTVAKPVGLEVKVRPDKSLLIRWQAEDGARGRFQVEVCYFDFECPINGPFHSTGIIEVERCAAVLPHPDEVPKNQAWVVKVFVKAVSEDRLLSEAVQKQVAWDAELSVEETIQDLKQRVAEFERFRFLCSGEGGSTHCRCGSSAPWEIFSHQPLVSLLAW